MNLNKKTLFNITWSLLWFCIIFIPIATYLFVLHNQDTNLSFGAYISDVLSFTRVGSYLYDMLESIFTSSSSLYIGVPFDVGYLSFFAYVLSCFIIKFLLSFFVYFLRWLECLMDKFTDVGGTRK